MANRTDPLAKSIRGTNPQNLVEKILRTKIHQSTYWKEQCFGLTAETLVDKAMELDHLGGTHGGNRKPTPFMCLPSNEDAPDSTGQGNRCRVHKKSRVQPEYVRVLGAFYLRLTAADIDVYCYLEPLYNDYRKLRFKSNDGKLTLTHVDEFIDEILTKDYSCDIALPRIKKRGTLETLGSLEARRSAIEDDFEEEEKDGDDHLVDGLDYGGNDKDYYQVRSPNKENDWDRKKDSHKYRFMVRDYERDRYYARDYDRNRVRGRDRDRERDRVRHRVREDKDYGHERDRRDREHGRRSLSRSRSRSRSRDHGDGDDCRRRYHASLSPKKKKEKKAKKDDGTDHPDPEIAQQNRIRASLGLKPLKL
ncbi:hypothetical protein OROGR_010549 [Orobanche gracilis]